MDEIVQEFLVESHENLDQLDQDLIALEQEPTSRDLLGSVFRTIHTIKGTSGGGSAFGSSRRKASPPSGVKKMSPWPQKIRVRGWFARMVACHCG